MSPEVISIASLGVAIVGTLVVFFRWLRQDMRDLRRDMRDLRQDMRDMSQDMRDIRREMREMENRLNTRIDALIVYPPLAKTANK